jgi:hypothetical protein
MNQDVTPLLPQITLHTYEAKIVTRHRPLILNESVHFDFSFQHS